MRNAGQTDASTHNFVHWHPIPKLPEELLQYSHPKMREYIHELVGTAEEILRENRQLQKEVDRLRDKVQTYEKRLLKDSTGNLRLVKDSHNSNQPPSSDQFKKPRRTQSQREFTGRQPGGQRGHPGKTLNPVSHPDSIQKHTLNQCSECKYSLNEVAVSGLEKRQVFDLILPKLHVTEHQVEKKLCPHCQHTGTAIFPPEVRADTQYGTRFKSWAIYFMNYQLIPFERTSEICEDLAGHPLSLGTLMNFSTQGFRSLRTTELKIKSALIHTDVLHADESGIDVGGKNQWLHVASNHKLTHFAIHERRGMQAMEEIGIIPAYRGTLVHDHFNPYFSYSLSKHALCNAHILRELDFIQESDHHEEWAGAMKCFLIKARDTVRQWRKRKLVLLPEEVDRLETEYDEILIQGFTYHRKKKKPPPEIADKKRKTPKSKQLPGKNLLDRLQYKKACVLAFLRDPNVPFTNNRAERDIRMNKLKQKISGCFRSHGGAAAFCRIRSYISSAKKQGHSPLFALEKALKHRPISLT